jgi:hypothetical protein
MLADQSVPVQIAQHERIAIIFAPKGHLPLSSLEVTGRVAACRPMPTRP